VLAVFLGAGFSKLGGVPLARELFDVEPLVDRITRYRLVSRVRARWEDWQTRIGGSPEEYLAHLETLAGAPWRDAVWYAGLVIALAMGRVEMVGARTTVVRHTLARTTGVHAHEEFWSQIFTATTDVAVLTTNYDVLAERGLRHSPRPRVPRPGFNYGHGSVYLRGGGYPSYSHIQAIEATGSVPLLKLHGSVSWAVRGRDIDLYHDCRPAIRGDAAILAPVTDKLIPPFLVPVWARAKECLQNSSTWIIVGYSLPPYDVAVRELLSHAVHSGTVVHVFDPDATVGERYGAALPGADIRAHDGLPRGLGDLSEVLSQMDIDSLH
jgi:hypothetical protein